MMTGGLFWQWIGGHLPECGDCGGLGVRTAFLIQCIEVRLSVAVWEQP
jgi:hypothetical protein